MFCLPRHQLFRENPPEKQEKVGPWGFGISTDLRMELVKAAYDLPEDFQFEILDYGHSFYFYNGKWQYFTPYELTTCLQDSPIFTEHDAEKLIQAWQNNKPLEQNDRIPFSVSRYLGHEKCIYCHMRDFYTDGFKVWPETGCPAPNGLDVQVELEVPSGRLIIGNDFRDKFNIEDDDFYVNALPEIKRCTEEYAKIGMLHFFVGNSCPGVYKTGKDQFAISSSGYDEATDENLTHEGEEVASVCTDLWWVSIVDGDEADRRGLEYRSGHWSENEPVEVTPGTYVLDYYGLRKDFDRDDYSKPTLYAELRRKEDS